MDSDLNSILMRAIFIAAALFFGILSVLLIVQRLLFMRIVRSARDEFRTVRFTHNLIGTVLICVSLVFLLIFAGAAYLMDDFGFNEYPSFVPMGESMPSSGGPFRSGVSHGPHPASLYWAGRRASGTLSEGDGILEGRLLLDGAGVPNQRIRLLLNKKNYTPYAETDEQGTYRIRVPKGDYFYCGWELGHTFDFGSLAGKVLVHDGIDAWGEGDRKRLEQIDQIVQDYPLAEAKEKIDELLGDQYPDTDTGELYILSGGDEPGTVPPIAFASPIEIVSPSSDAVVHPNDLRIEWIPHAKATSYEVAVGYEEKNPGTIIYEDLASFPGITGTVLTADDILPKIQRAKRRRYWVEINAYDADRSLISRSYPYRFFQMHE